MPDRNGERRKFIPKSIQLTKKKQLNLTTRPSQIDFVKKGVCKIILLINDRQ